MGISDTTQLEFQPISKQVRTSCGTTIPKSTCQAGIGLACSTKPLSDHKTHIPKDSLITGQMEVIKRCSKDGDCYIPQLILAGEVFAQISAIIEPALESVPLRDTL